MSEPDDRVVSPDRHRDDHTDYTLRPTYLGDLIGQERVRQNLAILI